MRSPPRSPRPSARPSAPRCQPTQADLAREAATREDCCGRKRGPGYVEGGREGGGEDESHCSDRWHCRSAGLVACTAVLSCSVDTCVSRRRVCESAALDARTAGGGWPLSMSSASHVPRCFWRLCFRSCTVHVPHTPHARGKRTTTTRSLSVRSTPPSSFGSSCVAACTATGGNGAQRRESELAARRPCETACEIAPAAGGLRLCPRRPGLCSPCSLCLHRFCRLRRLCSLCHLGRLGRLGLRRLCTCAGVVGPGLPLRAEAAAPAGLSSRTCAGAAAGKAVVGAGSRPWDCTKTDVPPSHRDRRRLRWGRRLGSGVELTGWLNWHPMAAQAPRARAASRCAVWLRHLCSGCGDGGVSGASVARCAVASGCAAARGGEGGRNATAADTDATAGVAAPADAAAGVAAADAASGGWSVVAEPRRELGRLALPPTALPPTAGNGGDLLPPPQRRPLLALPLAQVQRQVRQCSASGREGELCRPLEGRHLPAAEERAAVSPSLGVRAPSARDSSPRDRRPLAVHAPAFGT
eukprot:scaffold16105_cov50-Phaeocystis_antarctica.AAC.3